MSSEDKSKRGSPVHECSLQDNAQNYNSGESLDWPAPPPPLLVKFHEAIDLALEQQNSEEHASNNMKKSKKKKLKNKDAESNEISKPSHHKKKNKLKQQKSLDPETDDGLIEIELSSPEAKEELGPIDKEVDEKESQRKKKKKQKKDEIQAEYVTHAYSESNLHKIGAHKESKKDLKKGSRTLERDVEEKQKKSKVKRSRSVGNDLDGDSDAEVNLHLQGQGNFINAASPYLNPNYNIPPQYIQPSIAYANSNLPIPYMPVSYGNVNPYYYNHAALAPPMYHSPVPYGDMPGMETGKTEVEKLREEKIRMFTIVIKAIVLIINVNLLGIFVCNLLISTSTWTREVGLQILVKDTEHWYSNPKMLCVVFGLCAVIAASLAFLLMSRDISARLILTYVALMIVTIIVVPWILSNSISIDIVTVKSEFCDRVRKCNLFELHDDYTEWINLTDPNLCHSTKQYKGVDKTVPSHDCSIINLKVKNVTKKS